ncbi:hypothetical protein NC652_031803 [Populus alba x Populus x berolinensis]|nr:hypothetical protein NC652_031803 [Populus alba x Populus x berolinensis]
MTGRRFFTFTTEDAAVRLGLIHRVRGLEEAENYFNKLSVKLKTKYTYGAILNGCVREKSVQKAEAVMQEMREGGMTTSSFPYNILIILYSQTGDFDKIPPLLKEMERNGIAQDKYTLRNLIAASVAASDISGVERILKLMEENPELGLDWKLYAMAADAYLKIGSIETALTMLKKLEKWMAFRKKKAVFNFLLSLYAKTGNKDELYRIWNLYKPSSESMDTSYCCMIDSLTKLDDIEGAEKIFEEWESQCTSMYDFRVLNGLLVAYCNRGLFEKAEAAIEKAVQGRTPYASTWHVMAKGYMEHDQIPKAVEMLKRAVNVGRDWKPDPILVNACLEDDEHLLLATIFGNVFSSSLATFCRITGEVEAAEELSKLVMEHCHFDPAIYDELKTYTTAISHSLNRRISMVEDPKVPIIPVLEKWVQEGQVVTNSDLKHFIRKLRKIHRFSHALQISQWMSDQRGHNLSPGDVAVRLDLISKVHGLEQAVTYFNSVPESLRGLEVYGALLNCYAHYKHLEEAEATMRKMREMGFVRNVLSYNVMLNLYYQMGKYEKIQVLMQEMEKWGICFSNITYKILLNAYVATSNIEEIKKILMKMEADPLVSIDWYAYVVAANGYLKAGLIDKTLTMLWRSEQLISGKSARFACETLLSLYTAVGNKEQVYRVWNLYKTKGRSLNSSYLCMINSLLKLDDVDGAERIWEEWVSIVKCFDIRIPNLMVSTYSKKGLWEKAEAFVGKIVASGIKIEASTLDRLATGYHVGGQMLKASETIKKAISISQPGWEPNVYTLAACLEYLKGREDVKKIEDLLKILKEHCHPSSVSYDRLNSSIIDKENLCARALDHMEGEDQALNGERPAATEFEDKDSTEI